MRDRHIFRSTGSHSDPPLEGVLQRKCACGQHTVAGGECSACEQKKSVLQRAAANNEETPAQEAPPVVHEVLNSAGRPLDVATRAFMEPQFGHDFSTGVRIHTDAKAAESARSVNALAYTVGQHVVFGERQYQPQTDSGRKLIAHELTHVVQQTAANAPRVLARQPAPAPAQPAPAQPAPAPPPGWSDATGQNKFVTTVDETGKIQQGKLTTTGVWRVPVEGLTEGLQKGAQDTAIESSEKRAIALIPNTTPPSPVKPDANIPVDVLLHLHGFGIGYRELPSGQTDYAKILKPGEVRDVALYQMEQQLLAHVKSTNHFVIAILPQGSAKSGFNDLGTESTKYLNNVFKKLTPAYLPNNAVPGRVTVSGHSGGGPTVMAIANQRLAAKLPTNVFLFDAINSGCAEWKDKIGKDGQPVIGKDNKPEKECVRCESNEFGKVRDWVTARINTDLKNLSGKDATQDVADLQKSGARFRGVTSGSLKETNTCRYGFWYGKLKTEIEKTIKNLKGVDEAVRQQLRENYKVEAATGLPGTGYEPHERMIGGGRLEAALKD